MKAIIAIGVATACIGSIVACGGNGQTDEEAIKESVATYFEGFAQGNGEMACSRLTDDLARSFSEGLADGLTWLDTSTCESTIEGLAEVNAPSGVVNSVEVRGDTATAYLDKGTEVQLVKDDGEWLMNSGFTEK